MRYAEISDITALGQNLTAPQLQAAEVLLDTASAKLRVTAHKYGRDIDDMIADEKLGSDYAAIVKNVVVQSALRAIRSMENSPAVSQESQSALGYSASITYLNAGQSLYFMKNELKELGLIRQSYGALEVF